MNISTFDIIAMVGLVLVVILLFVIAWINQIKLDRERVDAIPHPVNFTDLAKMAHSILERLKGEFPDYHFELIHRVYEDKFRIRVMDDAKGELVTFGDPRYVDAFLETKRQATHVEEYRQAADDYATRVFGGAFIVDGVPHLTSDGLNWTKATPTGVTIDEQMGDAHVVLESERLVNVDDMMGSALLMPGQEQAVRLPHRMDRHDRSAQVAGYERTQREIEEYLAKAERMGVTVLRAPR